VYAWLQIESQLVELELTQPNTSNTSYKTIIADEFLSTAVSERGPWARGLRYSQRPKSNTPTSGVVPLEKIKTHDGYELPALRSLVETIHSLKALSDTIAYIDGTRLGDASKLFKKFLTDERVEQLFESKGPSGAEFSTAAIQKWLDVVYNANYTAFVENSVFASDRIAVSSRYNKLKETLGELGFALSATHHLQLKTPVRVQSIPFEHLILAVSLIEEASFCDATARGAKTSYR
jgi:hypothetical protein